MKKILIGLSSLVQSVYANAKMSYIMLVHISTTESRGNLQWCHHWAKCCILVKCRLKVLCEEVKTEMWLFKNRSLLNWKLSEQSDTRRMFSRQFYGSIQIFMRMVLFLWKLQKKERVLEKIVKLWVMHCDVARKVADHAR